MTGAASRQAARNGAQFQGIPERRTSGVAVVWPWVEVIGLILRFFVSSGKPFDAGALCRLAAAIGEARGVISTKPDDGGPFPRVLEGRRRRRARRARGRRLGSFCAGRGICCAVLRGVAPCCAGGEGGSATEDTEDTERGDGEQVWA